MKPLTQSSNAPRGATLSISSAFDPSAQRQPVDEQGRIDDENGRLLQRPSHVPK